MDWCDRPPWRCVGAEGKGVPRVVCEQSRLASRGELGDNCPVDGDAREGPPRFEASLEALARSWNRLDPELLAPWLVEDVRYESLETELCLTGRRMVLDHLRRKVRRIEEAGEAARIRAQLGWVRTVGGGRRECVISSQGDVERAAVFLVALAADGRIERIEVCTSDPDPRLADGSEIFPC